MQRNERKLNGSENFWGMISFACLFAAIAGWWWRGAADAAFVFATLGVVAWFISIRQSLRRTANAANVDHASKIETGNLGEEDEA